MSDAARLAVERQHLNLSVSGMSGGLSPEHAALGRVREESLDVARGAQVDEAEVRVLRDGGWDLSLVLAV